MLQKKILLPTIVFAQFCGTSLWFAGNSVIEDLSRTFHLQQEDIGHLTSAVQLGFIVGTLIFALLSIADRFHASKVFFFCALVGSIFNLGITLEQNTLSSILALRFASGFFLAGIYPVGMKIAADHYQKGLGKSLGFLVGALVLGTAFPHLLKSIPYQIDWTYIFITTSTLASLGGLLIFLLVPEGPFKKKGSSLQLSAFLTVFKENDFRAAAFGYFGHMWELYTFWAFVPFILKYYAKIHNTQTLNISLLSFLIIGIGGIACILGGYISSSLGTKKTAFLALLLSCTCCFSLPFMIQTETEFIFLTFLFIWGMVVIADSPLFSTLVAQTADQSLKGTALTIVNCIGFTITIFSIQLTSHLWENTNSIFIFSLLGIGPILGLIALGLKSNSQKSLTP
ncbi:MFS transporter [Sediminitomix flava]|uniref:Putative MFS family arabinose efflux permease n=1 Tax=Sediminitomix flava TaxID=379075 RepID=A0A315ZG33_SEDFL|nr:MFS transporter [Sediminitomix flava]PWJ43818.1 putative MFS family arabinose efflux permease [Sediminitomix flava]